MQKKLSFKEVIINKNICKVSVVGLGMKTNAGVANTMFSQLAKYNKWSVTSPLKKKAF